MIHKIKTFNSEGIWNGNLDIEISALELLRSNDYYYDQVYKAINKHGEYTALTYHQKTKDSWFALIYLEDRPYIIWLEHKIINDRGYYVKPVTKKIKTTLIVNGLNGVNHEYVIGKDNIKGIEAFKNDVTVLFEDGATIRFYKYPYVVKEEKI